ncbi:hypothetical protein EWB00_003809, partial [Schistosoma japonicum]
CKANCLRLFNNPEEQRAFHKKWTDEKFTDLDWYTCFSDSDGKCSSRCFAACDFPSTECLNRCTTFVHPGTSIYTEDLKNYLPLRRFGYVYCFVIYQRHFADLTTGVHTQNIKAYRSHLKKVLELYGLEPHE